MKKFINYYLFAMIIAVTAVSFASCSDDDDDNSSEERDLLLGEIISQYVNNTVYVTYENLADASIKLEEACIALQNDPTNLQKATKATEVWKDARLYWELSEAFLFGPASKKGIDPHIDTWPLDQANLDKLLNSPSIMEDFDADYATNNLQGGSLGFHAIEYVLFKDSKPRTDASENELKYAVGVAGDLKLQCLILEAAWKGMDNITDEKKEYLEEAEAEQDDEWGENLMNAGLPGSTYKTKVSALHEIISGDKGCFGIANEVGNTKIADPVASNNVLDVESWFSWNSKQDFQDNIRGIYNSCMGGVDGKRNENKSIYSYVKSFNPDLAEKLKDAMIETIGSDNKTGIGTIIQPFRNNLEKSKNQVAMDTCNDLCDVLREVADAISNQ
ncbi:imelysin family protein [Bacteroides sp. 224]|uniref:imelysin family protein n=1 Tax=Bacteroides sp. 224 TaxID=2302936 RepID=UPI0013D833F7|nr:imelysin family protein [Bacteroides sp. 224]